MDDKYRPVAWVGLVLQSNGMIMYKAFKTEEDADAAMERFQIELQQFFKAVKAD